MVLLRKVILWPDFWQHFTKQVTLIFRRNNQAYAVFSWTRKNFPRWGAEEKEEDDFQPRATVRTGARFHDYAVSRHHAARETGCAHAAPRKQNSGNKTVV